MALKQLMVRFQGILNSEEFKTYEQICLDKLKEMGISTAAEWSGAMGYINPNGLAKVIKRIKTKMPHKLKIYYERRPRCYEAL
jgi:hypothetical protein